MGRERTAHTLCAPARRGISLACNSQPRTQLRGGRHLHAVAVVAAHSSTAQRNADRRHYPRFALLQDTVLGVFDLRGFSNQNADLSFVRFLVRRLRWLGGGRRGWAGLNTTWRHFVVQSDNPL